MKKFFIVFGIVFAIIYIGMKHGGFKFSCKRD